MHYFADMIEKRLASRKNPRVAFSDERKHLLNTGGGIVKALPRIGAAPFYLVNSDSIWIDGVRGNLARLAENFDPARMDALLLLAPSANSIGYAGRGDFAMTPDGRLRAAPSARWFPSSMPVSQFSRLRCSRTRRRRLLADENVRPRVRGRAALRASP